ncbi:class I SAM-dependent methyltransferase [Sphaerospermopsis sp. FACHB-1094]|uniref:class I SAM-dependent methyltransferase n=1 Tax=Sphaerospermopsis sp. FACHB-1094 TaxID=2692861 RepID=UPI0016874CA7|nr:class I SAM-dependent methyltransferase [Sphaerospermopsis sp. FACHB-1094]MBD2131559.1 class I SAM-dependent methyltransferase [Sphaerospermopsis sp. FACHB-1094]
MTSNSNDKQYYENSELWGDRELTLVQLQVLNVLDSLCQELPSGSRILDLGCGDGIVLKQLISKYPFLEGYGVDISQEALSYLTPPLKTYHSDLESLPFQDDFFDLCFSIDVLEHIIPDKLTTVIGEIHRVSRGAILLVSPFLESDAVRTICPYCGCIFSPYYHLTRFNLKVWESLLSNYMRGRSMRFLPFGDSKPYIPPGVGNLMVGSGACVSHQHQTICPQCKTSFSRSKPAATPNLSLLLSPYAAQNRNLFGLISEEMGVLTLPISNMEVMEKPHISDGIWVFTKENCNLTQEDFVVLSVQSIYEIDFTNANVVRSGADLFRKESYVVDNGELILSPNSDLIWKPDKNKNFKSTNNATTLRFIFPPEPNNQVVNLELFFTSKIDGTLKAIVYAVPPNDSKEIGSIKVRSHTINALMPIILYPDDKFITPFGIIVDLIWMPKIPSNTSNYNVDLQLHKIIDSQLCSQFTAMKYKDVVNIIPSTTKRDNKKYHLKISQKTLDKVNKVWYVEQGKIFDLCSGLYRNNTEDDCSSIILPILDNVYPEDIINNVEDNSAQTESNLGFGYYHGISVYDAITQKLGNLKLK